MSAHVRSLYGVKILKRKHRDLRALNKSRDEPTLYGDQVWQSSFLIMDYLKQHPLLNKQRVMDIGCGWGLLGIYCAKQFDSDVTLIDADSNVFPYALTHQALNDVSVKTRHAGFNDLEQTDFARQDVIVGADICFWPELSTQLKSLIAKAVSAKIKRIILADPGRNTFLQLAEHCSHLYHSTLLPMEIPGKTKSKKGYLMVIENPSSLSASATFGPNGQG